MYIDPNGVFVIDEEGRITVFDTMECPDCQNCPRCHVDAWFDGSCEGCEDWLEYVFNYKPCDVEVTNW